MRQKLSIDEEQYKALIQAVGMYSRLFSESDTPFFHSRFVEKLYVLASGSEDLSRKDMSFDARNSQSRAGIGVKTFVASGLTGSKKEKIAEFPKIAGLGEFADLSQFELAHKVSELRNKRIRSDAAEYGIALDDSIYHCLIRVPGQCMAHEEPYSLIDVNSIRPLDRQLNPSRKWVGRSGDTYFTDGTSSYSFNGAKSVLMKRFTFAHGVNGKPVPIEISKNIFESVLQSSLITNLSASGVDMNFHKQPDVSVVLPLYSTRGGQKHVAEKSGINQWMAGGRQRNFGEAYIPVPSIIHKLFPSFFPERDVQFSIELPNGKIIQAKICQDGRKALMSNPNTAMCEWLYALIDGELNVAQTRFRSRSPYLYSDLEEIGKDAVLITKIGAFEYKLEMAPLGAYENFIDEF